MLAEARLPAPGGRLGSVEALRERVEILEEENRQLRDLLKPRILLPREWRLAPQQAGLLIATRSAAPGVLTWERATIAIQGFEGQGDGLRKAVLYQLRQSLKIAGVPIHLETVWGVGLMLAPESVAAFDRLTGRAAP